MPDKQYSSNSYRYGFNGKEQDNEVKGTGNQYDYGFRIYDPRICKFLSIDPLTKKYPHLTPYQFGSNRPIDGSDLDGKEWSKETNAITDEGTYIIKIKIVNSSTLTNEQIETHLANGSTYLDQSVGYESNSSAKIVYEFVDASSINDTKDFYMVFQDQKPGLKGGGETRTRGNTEVNRMDIFIAKDESSDYTANTIAHEIGHTGGLWDNVRIKSGAPMPGSGPIEYETPIDKRMSEMSKNDNKLNLMYNMGSDPILFSEQLLIFDETIPAARKTVTNTTPQDNTFIPKPAIPKEP